MKQRRTPEDQERALTLREFGMTIQGGGPGSAARNVVGLYQNV
jgi:hypothetical protein